MARCKCKTAEGKRCKLTAADGKVYCHVHQSSTAHCNAMRAKHSKKSSPKKK